MTVYVDDMMAPFGRMLMSHLVADTRDELDAMVDAIGVQRRWIQHEGSYQEHYDISKGKRALAIQAGAVEIAYGDLGRWLLERRRRTIPKLAFGCLQCERGGVVSTLWPTLYELLEHALLMHPIPKKAQG